MLRISVEEKPPVTGDLQETFVSAAMPRHPQAQAMLKCWHTRPADGFLTGRELPSADPGSPLSHVAIWQPQADPADFIFRQRGASLKPRFATLTPGVKMSEILSPQLFAYLRHISEPLMDGAHTDGVSVSLSHSGFTCLHYEIVLFAARTPDGSFDLVSGIYYF